VNSGCNLWNSTMVTSNALFSMTSQASTKSMKE
jgi:hypothetical protein